MPRRAPLAVAFDLAFEEAIAAARARQVMLPADYASLPADKRAQAYTVGGLAALDQVQAVMDELTRQLEQGGTFADFKAWARTAQLGLPPHTLETVYRNGIQQSYNAGHWRRFERDAETRPYLMYDAINDSRTRPAHRALDGVIRPVTDAFWDTHSPALGHRCRCRLINLTREQAQARGGATQNPPAEGVADAGWGRKPIAHARRLFELLKQKAAGVAPALGQAVLTPQTLDGFIAAGHMITTELPDGATDPHASVREIIDGMRRAGISGTGADVDSSGPGATLVRQASALFPAAWNAASDAAGPLQVRARTRARGWSVTYRQDYTRAKDHFGVVRGITKGEGQIEVRNGDLGNAVHEYAHRLQAVLPELDQIFQALHARRTAGDLLKRLSTLVPGGGYRPDELAREDQYLTPYQGKEYAGLGAMEVMTIAFEYVLGLAGGAGASWGRAEENFSKAWTHDREMLDLVVGLLYYWKP